MGIHLPIACCLRKAGGLRQARPLGPFQTGIFSANLAESLRIAIGWTCVISCRLQATAAAVGSLRLPDHSFFKALGLNDSSISYGRDGPSGHVASFPAHTYVIEFGYFNAPQETSR